MRLAIPAARHPQARPRCARIRNSHLSSESRFPGSAAAIPPVCAGSFATARLAPLLGLAIALALLALPALAPVAHAQGTRAAGRSTTAAAPTRSVRSSAATPARAARPAATAPRCEICGQAVSGRYFQTGGHTYCPPCYDRSPKCAGCGLPAPTAKGRSKGAPVCDACVTRIGLCASCGEALLGRYFAPPEPVAGISGFCETCCDTKPKCTICSLPYPAMASVDGQPACPTCLRNATRCSTCDQPLLGRYFAIEFQSGQFCRKCFEERAHCSFCNRPYLDDAPGVRELPDGRHSCPACAATAVTSLKEALDLLGETVRFLEREHGMRVRDPYDFVLVDNREMAFLTNRKPDAEAADRRPGRQQGLATTLQELGLFNSRMTPSSPRMTIALLSDLPRAAFLETAAHEYAHLWAFERNPDLTDKELNEGFAQWAAAKWLIKSRLNAPLARLEARRDSPYGTGYQTVRALEAGAGPRAVIDRMLRQPDGKPAPVTPLDERAAAAGRGGTRRGNAASAPDAPRPLAEILPATLLDGSYAFLRRAAVVTPATLRLRAPAAAPRTPPRETAQAAPGNASGNAGSSAPGNTSRTTGASATGSATSSAPGTSTPPVQPTAAPTAPGSSAPPVQPTAAPPAPTAPAAIAPPAATAAPAAPLTATGAAALVGTPIPIPPPSVRFPPSPAPPAVHTD